MSYNQTTTNLVTGLPGPFVALIVIRWAISMLGCGLNISLVFVTIRSRTLHGTCNFLIAANALCSALFEPTLSIGLYIAISGIYFVPLRNCFYLQAIPAIFGHLTLATMLAIGLDRLLVNISFSPFWNIQKCPITYLIGSLAICFGYSLFSVWQMFRVQLDLPQLPVICSSPNEVLQGEIGRSLYRVNVAMNLALLAEYGYLWLAFTIRKHRLGLSAPSKFTRRIIRSLTAITLLVAIGWVANSIVRLLLPQFGLSPEAISYATFACSFLPIIAIASNAPLLFIFSHEYRRAYTKQFPRLLAGYALNMFSVVAPKTFPPYVLPEHGGIGTPF